MGFDKAGLLSSGSVVFTVVSAVASDTVVSAEVTAEVWVVVVTASVVVEVVVSVFAVVDETGAAVVSGGISVAGGAVGGAVSGISVVKATSSVVVSGDVSEAVESVSEDSLVLGEFSEVLVVTAVSVSLSFGIVVKAAVSLVRSAVGSADADKLSDISAVSGGEEQAVDKIEITADRINAKSFFKVLFITINPFLSLSAFFKN